MIAGVIAIACAAYLGTRDWTVVLFPIGIWVIWEIAHRLVEDPHVAGQAFLVVVCCIGLIAVFGGVWRAIVGTGAVLMGFAAIVVLTIIFEN